MGVKTIKDVDEETWRKIRTLSVEEDVKMGKLIRNMAENYIKNKESAWNKILSGDKLLSDSEADDIKKITDKLRKERGFR
jgi:hypothetical protein